MYITSVTLRNYRNYSEAVIEPCQGVTVFTGDNAQGKTNILEAIYMTCTGRSHRTSHDRELIKTGEEAAKIQISGERRDGRHDVEMWFSTVEKRSVKVNGSRIARSGELLGHITGVLFAPEDLRVVKDGPAERRRFIDMELSQLRPAYYYALQKYNRALKQRGALLKECALTGRAPATIDMWDEQLAESGALIMEARAEFVRRLAEKAKEIHSEVSGGRDEMAVAYAPDVQAEGGRAEVQAQLTGALLKSRPNDIKRVQTGVGPHRDDISVCVNGMDARAYGSQGQVRTCALSLKLSEI